MKALSIEEKVKAYDSVVSKLGRLMAQGVDPLITRADVQDFFPELKESEDERIRKEICDYIKQSQFSGGGIILEASTRTRWLAWLEKQGEQKLADKVEPKFHDGDWIVFNGITLYIEEVVKGYYRTISKGGITNSYDWGIDNVARLWTIQDAKDGDVLATDMVIFIFKENIKGSVFMYCNYTLVSNNFCVSDTAEVNKEYVHPATKEQRNLFFQKMKEAGYECRKENKL